MEDTKEHIAQPVSGDNMPSTPARWRTVVQWFVMRDLKRTNAKLPAYQMLGEMGMEVFTPMVWKIVSQHGKRVRMEVPFMQDLLFVHESRERLDPVVELTNTLQYRFLRDGKLITLSVVTTRVNSPGTPTYTERTLSPQAESVRFITEASAAEKLFSSIICPSA